MQGRLRVEIRYGVSIEVGAVAQWLSGVLSSRSVWAFQPWWFSEPRLIEVSAR